MTSLPKNPTLPLPPPAALDAYVLDPFTREESTQLPDVLEAAAAACTIWSRDGMEAAMNRYNRNVLKG